MIVPGRPIRVLVLDDNNTFLEILSRFIQENHGGEFVVVGTARESAEALAQANALQPQVALLDFDLVLAENPVRPRFDCRVTPDRIR